jgi:HAD superfamily hydrolase (TIGR01549 family)
MAMNKFKIISFDVEGTLVTTDYSYAIWFEAIPEHYARKHNITIEQAKKTVISEYEKIGDQKIEWYDIKYWFDKFDLGNYEPAMEQYHDRIRCYPEVTDILLSLSRRYELIATSGSPKEFLNHLLRDIKPYFRKVFSSVSDYKQIKNNEFYLKICSNLDVTPGQILHIGDNWQFDVVAASEIGIQAFFLDRKGQNAHHNSLRNLAQLKDFVEF